MAFAGLRFRPPPQQQFEFFFSTDQLGQAACVKSIEAAFHGSGSQCHPGSHRPCDTLQVLGSEVLKLEQDCQRSFRVLSRDNHAVGLRDALQARRKVWRLADDGLLLRSAGPDQITNDHQTRRDTDTLLQGCVASSGPLHPPPTPARRARPAPRRPRALGDSQSRPSPRRLCTSLRSRRSVALFPRRTSGRPKLLHANPRGRCARKAPSNPRIPDVDCNLPALSNVARWDGSCRHWAKLWDTLEFGDRAQ